MKSKEFQEVRGLLLSAILVMAGAYVVDDDDNSFLGQLKKRAYREAMTILQAMDITMFFVAGRVASFGNDLVKNLKAIVMLEKYQKTGKYGKRGELKGVKGLQRQLTE